MSIKEREVGIMDAKEKKEVIKDSYGNLSCQRNTEGTL